MMKLPDNILTKLYVQYYSGSRICTMQYRKEGKSSMKKLLSCVTAAVMLAATAIPAAAADQTTAEATPPTLEERVADGLAVYERELAHCDLVKQISAEETVTQWNNYLADFSNRYLNALDADKELKELLFGADDPEGDPVQTTVQTTVQSTVQTTVSAAAPAAAATTAPAPSELAEVTAQSATAVSATVTTASTETTVTTTVSDGYEGKNVESIKRKYVKDELVARVKEVMPPDEFEKMCADPDSYRLYYMDGTIIVITNFAHTALDINDKLMLAYHIITLDPLSVAWDLSSLSATTVTEKLYNVVFVMNERNRELAQIEYEMTKMGLWNVKDEETTIPNYGAAQGSGRPHPLPAPGQTAAADTEEESVAERLGKLPQLVYDLTSGNDTYRVLDMEEPVYGIIAEQGAGQTGNDTLFFDYALDPDDLEFLRLEGDLFVSDPVHEVYIMISEYFSNPAKRVENIRFKDDTVMSYADVCNITNAFVGTDKDDTVQGYPETNFFWGKGGNDTFSGDKSADYLLGYDGDDQLLSKAGSNYAYGMDGNDAITLGGGDDFIRGGKGDDIIKSGGGSDIIYYELGDGSDIVDDTNGKGMHPSGGHDVIWLGEGIKPDEVHVTFADGHYEFVLHIMKTGDTITLPGNQYSGVSPVFPIEEIHFTDGTVWDRLALLEQTCSLYGTAQDDQITAVVDGDATFRKDYDGCITIYGYDGNDTLIGSGGNDQIYGGKGDDLMRGGSGDDTFYYELGDGNDLIDMGTGRGTHPQGGYNVLAFGEGILPDEVTVERSADDYSYTLWINKTGESVTMTGNVVSGVSKLFPIKEIRFADETVWKLDYLEANFVKWIRGTDGDDSINDSGDDDIVFCGKGNDYIRGKTGDDLFIYEKGDGRDTIQDSSIWGNGFNTLQLGEGISLDDLYFEKAKYNGYEMLRFYISDRGSFVQMSGVQEILFADGTRITVAEAQKTVKAAAELTSELAGDLSCDGTLNYDDLVLLKDYLTTANVLSYWEPADLNQDGVLNSADLSLLKAAIFKAK